MNDDKEKSRKTEDKEIDNQGQDLPPKENQSQEVENNTLRDISPSEGETESDLEEMVENEVVEEPSTVQTEDVAAAELIEAEAPTEFEVDSHEGDDISPPPEESESADQDTPAEEEGVMPTIEPPDAGPQRTYATRGQAFLMSFGCSTLALILALVISIGVLAGLNSGNLVFATPAQVSRLALEVEKIDKEVQGIEQDIDGLQSRVDNLDGLTVRMDEVEQTAKNLDVQVTSITSQVEAMDQKVQELVTDVETLKAESTRYQEFFNGLRELLSKVITTEEESNEQQPK